MRELIDVQSEAIGALFDFIGAKVGLICILVGSINNWCTCWSYRRNFRRLLVELNRLGH